MFRAVIAWILLLLWNRYVVSAGKTGLTLLRDGCMTAGVVFLGFTWFSYLHLDGVRPALFRKKQEKKKPKRGNSDIVDFADEHIISFAELDDEDHIICSMTANFICSVLYLAAALIEML